MTSGNFGPPEGGQPAEGAQPGYSQQPPPAYGPPPGYGQQPPGAPAGAPAGQPPGGFGQPQQQYGQPMYGGPGGAPPVQPYQVNKSDKQFGVVGTVIAGVGAIACVVAFTALEWFHEFDKAKFSDLADATGDRVGATGIATVYFGWLAWVLLAAAAIAAVAGNLPTSASSAARPLGAVLGLAGVGATFWAVKFAHFGGYTEFLKRADIGFYVAAGGFLLITIGAVMGPSRRR